MAAGSGPVPARPVPAEPAQRLVARIIDLMLVGLPLALVAQAALPRRTAEVVESVGLAALVLIYDTVLHARYGRTVGKRLVGIKVVPLVALGELDELGEETVRPEKALARAAVFALPMAARPVPLLGLAAGVCWVAGVALVLRRDQERRALHDRLAGTIVVNEVVNEQHEPSEVS